MRMLPFIRSLVLAVLLLAIADKSSAGILLSISFAPPPLPVYVQPLCPGEGYLWTPGYWAYGDDGFFWVPGTWILAPEPGLLWTPGYWGWGDGVYIFHEGYWGPRVGFYGGINYGFGYTGFGYEGGYWNHGAFFYNRSVNNVTHITNVYNRTVVVNNVTVNRVSYNGGNGGITTRATSEEQAAMRERHIPPSSVQARHLQDASTNRRLYESVNRGKPPIAATARPAQFSGHGVVGAKAAAGSYVPPATRTAASRPSNNAPPSRPAAAVHPRDLAPAAHPAAPNSGNAKQDRRYQQQQSNLLVKQQQERQKLQQKQEQEHRRLPQARQNPAREQQMEQRHQQQTRQLDQRQASQQQRIESRQPQARQNPKK